MRYMGWYGRPKANLALLLACILLSAGVLATQGIRSQASKEGAGLFIRMEHLGIDARVMESSIAIPLEDALMTIPGVKTVTSTSEYGKVSIQVAFETGIPYTEAYEAGSQAVWKIYGTLPGSVQKPVISGGNDDGEPVWMAQVQVDSQDPGRMEDILEGVVKPAVSRIPGVAKVETAGLGQGELRIVYDQERLLAMGLGGSSLAQGLASNDQFGVAGVLTQEKSRIPLSFDGRWKTKEDLASAPIALGQGRSTRLDTIATIHQQPREPDNFSRINGVPVYTVAVMALSGHWLPRLSQDLAAVQKELAEENIVLNVISDRGKSIGKMWMGTGIAVLQGAFAVVLASLVFLGSRGRLLVAFSVPLCLFLSLGFLAIIGQPLERFTLAGLAAGLGSAIDAVLLVAEALQRSLDPRDGAKRVAKLLPSLGSGLGTTLIVLVPLASLDAMISGMASLASSIAVVTVMGMVVAVLFLPPLYLGTSMASKPRVHMGIFVRLERLGIRTLSICAHLARTKAPLVLLGGAVMVVLALVVLLITPIDIHGTGTLSPTIYAHVEFEPGAHGPSVDERIAVWAKTITNLPGVKSVQTTAHRGSGSALITLEASGFDRAVLEDSIRKSYVPQGFVWIPENTQGRVSYEVLVYGDDDVKVQEYARKAASILQAQPGVLDVVLNFKPGPEYFIFKPLRDQMSAQGISFATIAQEMRGAMYGPVAYKRVGDKGEQDVRVVPRLTEVGTMDQVRGLGFLGTNGPVLIEGLGTFEKTTVISHIYRRDRKRSAALTIQSNVFDPRRLEGPLLAALKTLDLPLGYRMVFDPTALESANKVASIGGSFVLAMVLAWMIMVILAESLGRPSAVLLCLPISMSLPALLIVLQGNSIQGALAAAFVAVSGVAVNASVLVADELASLPGNAPFGPRQLYRAIRHRSPALVATVMTTIAGALPLLLGGSDTDELSRSIARVAVSGTAMSLVVALLVIPAVASLLPGWWGRHIQQRLRILKEQTI